MAETAKKAPAKKTAPAKPAAKTTESKPTPPPAKKTESSAPSKKVETKQKASLGGVVLVQVNPATNNGSSLAPAIITRVWNDEMVNLTVLSDGPDNHWLTSVTLLEKQPEEDANPDDVNLNAEDELEAKAAHNVTTGRVCFWPPRN